MKSTRAREAEPFSVLDDTVLAALRKVIDYINRYFAGEITLETLAKLSHYSADYLIRAFSRYTGRTPVAYVNFLRLRELESLLADSSLSASAKPV